MLPKPLMGSAALGVFTTWLTVGWAAPSIICAPPTVAAPQSSTLAHTLVLGPPAGFVPLKNGKTAPAQMKRNHCGRVRIHPPAFSPSTEILYPCFHSEINLNSCTMQELIADLHSLAFCAMRISLSTQGRRSRLWQTVMVSMAFARLTSNAITVLRISPGSSLCVPIGEHQLWDLPSVGSLTRNLLEGYLTMRYLADDQCCVDELALRRKIWEYHEALERVKMLRSALSQSARLTELLQTEANLRHELQ